MIVTTTKGGMDSALLDFRTGIEEYPDATVTWVEYWLEGVLVHRSVTAALKGREIKFDQGVFH